MEHLMTLDEMFDAAGLKAALEHPKAKLWAEVNHVDNFTIAIAQTIDHGIMDAFDMNNDEHCDWLNKHVKDAGRNWRPSYKGDYPSPYQNCRCRRIAAKAYEQLRAAPTT